MVFVGLVLGALVVVLGLVQTLLSSGGGDPGDLLEKTELGGRRELIRKNFDKRTNNATSGTNPNPNGTLKPTVTGETRQHTATLLLIYTSMSHQTDHQTKTGRRNIDKSRKYTTRMTPRSLYSRAGPYMPDNSTVNCMLISDI